MAQDDQTSLIQLTRNGPIVSGKPDRLREHFDAQHCIVLKSLLAPQLLEEIQGHLERAHWQSGEQYTSGTGTVLTSNDPAVSTAIHFLLNNPEFLSLIRIITGCDEISEFRFGAVYRMMSADQHQISWHNDLEDRENRQVGLSLNLSADVFRDGAFEIRERATEKLLAQVSNTGFGDALLFRVSSDFEHRVTPVSEGVPKTAYTGWFCATGANYLQGLIQRMDNGESVFP